MGAYKSCHWLLRQEKGEDKRVRASGSCSSAGQQGLGVAGYAQVEIPYDSILNGKYQEAQMYKQQLQRAQLQEATAADTMRRLKAQIDEEYEQWETIQKKIDDLLGG